MKKISLMVAILTLVAFVAVATAQQPAPAKPAGTPAPAPAKPAGTPAPAAAPAPAPAKVETFNGDVAKVDAMAKTIVVKDKKGEMTFVTDDKTKITMGGKDMPLGDLKEGMGANVSYKKDGAKNVAATIKVAAPKAAPAAQPKPASTKK